MDFQAIAGFSQKELEQFQKVCNELLSRTFLVRTNYVPGKGRLNNPDYVFLSTHFETVRDYLSLLDWDLRKDEYNGYYYLLSKDEVNRMDLTKIQTAILLALRLLYDENQEMLGFEHDAVCTIQDVLEKIITDYAIISTRPNMDEVKRAMTIMENHRIIQKIDGRLNQMTCKFAILPTVMTAVSSERLDAVVNALRKDDAHEEAEEDSAD